MTVNDARRSDRTTPRARYIRTLPLLTTNQRSQWADVIAHPVEPTCSSGTRGVEAHVPMGHLPLVVLLGEDRPRPMSRTIDVRFGKMPTTSLPRRSSRLSRPFHWPSEARQRHLGAQTRPRPSRWGLGPALPDTSADRRLIFVKRRPATARRASPHPPRKFDPRSDRPRPDAQGDRCRARRLDLTPSRSSPPYPGSVAVRMTVRGAVPGPRARETRGKFNP